MTPDAQGVERRASSRVKLRPTPAAPARVREMRQGIDISELDGILQITARESSRSSVLAAGTGYAIYSASHDRIHSRRKEIGA